MSGQYDAGHGYDAYEDYDEEVQIDFDDIKDEDSYYESGESDGEEEREEDDEDEESGRINYG